MFAMDLGQNEGPFKRKDIVGQPLVDKFSRTTFATRDQNANGHYTLKKSASPRIAILGPNTFSAEARNDAAIADEPTNTVNHDVKRIEEQMVLGYELLALYKQETGTLRGDIDCLMNTLINKVEDT
jgi:hypothetical protein